MAKFARTKDPASRSPLGLLLCSKEVGCAPRELAASCKIFVAGEIPAGAYLIKSGAIGLQISDKPALFAEVLGPDDVVALSETLGKHPFPVNAIALQPTTATFIGYEELVRLMRTSPTAARTILDVVAKRTRLLLKVTAELKARRHRTGGTKQRSSSNRR